MFRLAEGTNPMGKGFWTTVREFLGTEEQYQRMHGTKGSTGTDLESETAYHKSERLIGGDDQNHIHEGVTQTLDPRTGEIRAQEWSTVKGTYDRNWESGRGERSDRGREDR
jgi:hypothetical protein